MSGGTNSNQEESRRGRSQFTVRVIGVLIGVVAMAGGLWLAGAALGLLPGRLAVSPWVVFLGGAFVVLIGFVFFGCATGIIVRERGLNRLFGAIGILAVALFHHVALFGKSSSTIPFLYLLGERAEDFVTYLILALIDGLIVTALLRAFLPSLYRKLAPGDSVTESRRVWLGASVIVFLLFGAGAIIGLYGPGSWAPR